MYLISCCLDEMNLAPVEQYFAEFLSVIESRKSNEGGTITTDPILKKSTEDWYRVLTAELTGDNGSIKEPLFGRRHYHSTKSNCSGYGKHG